jgi:L-iditol 2-dehydrogenase
VDSGCVSKIPDGVRLEQAVLAHPLAACIWAQESANVGLGKTVAVLGAGPLGCLNALLASATGARRVVLIDHDAGRLNQALTVCPSACLIHMTRQNVHTEMAALTERRRAEVVLITGPVRRLYEPAFDLFSRGGTVDFFRGLPTTDPLVEVNVNVLRDRQFSLVGSRGAAPRHHELALEVLASGEIDVGGLLGEVFPLDEVIEVMTRVAAGEVFKAIVSV